MAKSRGASLLISAAFRFAVGESREAVQPTLAELIFSTMSGLIANTEATTKQKMKTDFIFVEIGRAHV